MKLFTRAHVSRTLRILAVSATACTLLAGSTLSAAADKNAAKKEEIVELIVGHHVSGVEKDQLNMDNIDTIIASLNDPYTQYFSPTEWDKFMDMLENNYTGIGIRVGSDDNGFFVNEVFPATPASEAGIQDGDYIVKVNGKSTEGKTTEELVAEITGLEGTEVAITIAREGKENTVKMKRKEIHIPALTTRSFDEGIGYIRVSSFSSDADELFSEEIDRLKADGMKSLILDLRDNPGGLLDTAGNMASRFIKKGNLIHTRDRSKTETPYPVKGNEPIDVPVIVLVNEFSASASEVLAGALQDYEIATLIGRKTFGKGSVQSLYELSDGSVLKLTVQEYLTPLKHPVNKIGLTPDIDVIGDASQLITALQQAGELDIQLELGNRGLSINGQSVTDNFKVLREKGMTYVPSRILAAIVEGEVSWDEADRSVVIKNGKEEKEFNINSEGMKVENGVSYIALSRFQTQFQELVWTDHNGKLSLIENGRK